MDVKQRSLELHEKLKGKFEIVSRVEVDDCTSLSLAYTPGVAEPCRKIHEDKSKAYIYTRKWNTVAVVSDGSAVLGLGNIGALAGLPVMEGKAILFKEFGDVDAFPIVLDTQDVDEIVQTVKNIAPSFGGINLEDISAPRCFEVERRLKEELDIPVFHDDQHGTAIVVLAGLINALKIAKKEFTDIKVVINGPGAAGTAICKLLQQAGVHNIIMCDIDGILYRGKQGMDWAKCELAETTNPTNLKGDLTEAVVGADVFIGVSAPKVLTSEMVKTMNSPIIFAMANPEPEIMPGEALEAGALVVGTGRSDFPNQVNNVLAFPGIFRGVLDAKANSITDEMKMAAAFALSSLVSEEELSNGKIIPSAFDERVCGVVSDAVRIIAQQR